MTLIPLKDYCRTHGLNWKRARRYARDGAFGEARKVLGRWSCPEGMVVPALPIADPYPGRERYFIYLTEAEYGLMRDSAMRVIPGPALHAQGVEQAQAQQRVQAACASPSGGLLMWLAELIAISRLRKEINDLDK